jgi:hypothetical protein
LKNSVLTTETLDGSQRQVQTVKDCSLLEAVEKDQSFHRVRDLRNARGDPRGNAAADGFGHCGMEFKPTWATVGAAR